jgi:inosose dehydratase
MTVTRSQIALNAIQWINLKQPEDGPKDEPIWLYNDPAWRCEQPKVHQQIRDAGFESVMIEVLATQTLQSYKRMLDAVGLNPAPGFVDIGLPESFGLDLKKGSAEWVHWFDRIRRRAEETNFLGLDTVFVSPAMLYEGNRRISERAAVGAFFDQEMLDKQVEVLAEAAEVLRAEGVRAGLHNHVGSLVETEYEIDYVLSNIDASLLGASLDIGHIAWTGADFRAVLRRHKDRLLDLHIKDIDEGIAAASRAKPSSYYEVADQRFFLEPGLGDIDFDGLLADLNEYGFTGWIIIEVDRATMDPFESAKFSWRWVQENFPA